MDTAGQLSDRLAQCSQDLLGQNFPVLSGSSVPFGTRNDPLPCAIASVESAIPDVFAALGINGDLCQMRYQPGNAYNEEMINAAKNVGKEIFVEMNPDERKRKINEQNCVDREDELKRLREEGKASSGESEDEKAFTVFDEQREVKNSEGNHEANKELVG
uniref:Uncharacterized protein n=1 Tax=Parascaris equorum TaxID=6256 RepID=A0A914RID9_PAREQ